MIGVQAGGATGADKVLVDNCFFQQWGTNSVFGNSGDTDAVHCRYCSALYQQADANNTTTGFRYVKVTNVAVLHHGGTGGHKDFLNLNGGSVDYAAHDDSGSEAGLDNLIAVDQFVSIVDDAMDLSLKSGSDLEGEATVIVGLTVDWEGDARDGATPDIGADELVAAVGLSIPIAMHHYKQIMGVN